jgi:hypothetical protein
MCTTREILGVERTMRIELFPVWAGGKAGYLCNVMIDGDLVLERSRDPECDLARVLQSRGISGQVTVLDGNTGKARSIVNVDRLAKSRSYDDKRGLGFERWKAFPGLAVEGYSPESGLPVPTILPEANEAA